MLELEHVSKYYHNNGVTSKGLDDISINFNKGEIVAITGESGSGKSTLLNVISRLDSFDEGEIYYKGNETSYFSVNDMDQFRKNKIGFIFQNYNIIDSYTVLENVMLPLLINGYTKKEAKKKAIDILKRVGLDKRVNNRGTELSGGEKQRCVIARSLSLDSEILACDEPTGNLDSKTGREIVELISEVGKDKLVLIVTHNFDEVSDLVTRKIKLHDGKIIEDIKYKEILEDSKEELNLDYKKVENKVNFRIALSNLISTPKKTILSFLIFIVIAFFSLTIIENISKEVNKDTSQKTFAYASDNKYLLYDKDYNALDVSQIKDLGDSFEVNPFYTNTLITLDSIKLETNNEYRYIPNIYAVYEPNVDGYIKDGRKAQSESEFVLYLPSNYTMSYQVGDMYQISSDFKSSYAYINGTITNNVRYNTSSLTNKSFILTGIGYSDYVTSPVVTLNSTFEKFARFEAVKSSLTKIDYATIGSTTINRGVDIVYDLNRKTHIAQYDASTFYIDSDDSSLYYLNYKLFDIKDIPTTGDNFKDNYTNYNGEECKNVLVIGYDYFNYIKDAYEVSLYSTKNIEDNLKELDIAYLKANLSEKSATQIISELELYLLVIGSLILLEILYFITYAIIRKIYESKTETYTIFRTLGVTVSDMKKISIFETLILSTFSTIFVYIIMTILGAIFKHNDFFKIYYSMNFISTIIYFALTIFMGYLISKRFNKKLFSKTIRESLWEAK